MYKNNELGRTMIEILLVISLLGILSISLVGAINSVYSRYKLSRVGEQIREISKVIHDRYMSQGHYLNVDVEELIKESIAPKDMVLTKDTLRHAFGGGVNVTSARNTFSIRFLSLNYKACTDLALLNWMVNDSSYLVRLSINDVKYSWQDDNKVVSNKKYLPITVDEAASECKNNSNNTLLWEFD